MRYWTERLPLDDWYPSRQRWPTTKTRRTVERGLDKLFDAPQQRPRQARLGKDQLRLSLGEKGNIRAETS
jgi:hypothetical protein